MKNSIFSLAMLSLIASSCADNDINNPVVNPEDKEMISFSLSDGKDVTRAGFTGGDTRIVARIQSDANSQTTLYTKTSLKAAQDNATGDALATSYSLVTYSDGQTRYWDDAYGRKANLSVYAVAIPNSTADTKLKYDKLGGDNTWKSEETPNNSIQWDVTTDQSLNPLAAEDLVYSNNIQENGKDGRYTWDYVTGKYPELTGATTHADGRLVFTQKFGAQESDAGHFDKGHLVFKHSLSRLTIVLEEGAGFDGVKNTAADFKFTTDGENICLKNMITSGTLNIKEGTWGNIQSSDITKMAPIGDHYGANGTYASQMLPGYKFYKDDGTESVKNVMQFVIDDNTYYVTQAQVFAALNTNDNTTGENPKVSVKAESGKSYIEMEQGKNYILTVSVKKTGIENVTATLADWVKVEGSTSINNAHLTFSMTADGAACDKDIDLYRLGQDNTGYDADNYTFSFVGKNWFGNYLTDAAHKTTLEHTALSSNKWTTPWYFESNKTYYHFRSVDKDTPIVGNTGDDADSKNDYFNITGGETASTDPHWGAPMQTVEGKTYLTYDTEKGYEDFLRPAIGATESTIAIQEIHMMSNIEVILKTPNDGAKVKLEDGENKTIVKITRLATSGTVEMGRGLVTPATTYTGEHTMTTPTSFWKTSDTETQPYTFTVVPQALSRNESSEDDTDYIGIFIQTPDNNQYYVVKQLIKVTASDVSNERNQKKYQPIKRWFPGHKYIYTITISKKGIEDVTATVADWVTVSGNVGDITLED